MNARVAARRSILLAMLAAPAASLAQTMPAAATRATLDPDPAKRADQLITNGLAYLKTRQNADGSWGTDKDPPAITALALRAFAVNGQAKLDFAKHGYGRLLAFQMPDGGIYRDALANYNTSIAVTALAAAKDPTYQVALDRAVAYVKGLQWSPDARGGSPTSVPVEADRSRMVSASETDPFSGGWGYGRSANGRPDLSNAQMALDALHDAGVDASDPAMRRAINFLAHCQNSSETNDSAWASDDGGFVYGPGADKNGDSEAGNYTDASGKKLWRSYGSMTYAGLKSMIYAGLTPNDPRVKAAVGWAMSHWTLDENPGLGVANPANAKGGLYYYYHTLGRALAAYGQPTLTTADGNKVDWRVALIDKLAALQQADGSWVGEKRWMENNPILVTAYAVAALQSAKEDLGRTAP